jgi:hypothetical protein
VNAVIISTRVRRGAIGAPDIELNRIEGRLSFANYDFHSRGFVPSLVRFWE